MPPSVQRGARGTENDEVTTSSKASRWDNGKLSEPIKTAEGFLRVRATLTRSGVFLYVLPDGTERRELRDDAEVNDPASVASLASVPVTAPHPTKDGVRVMVTPQNFSEYSQGSVGVVTKSSDGRHQLLESELLIGGKDALEAVEVKGWRQVSCGYDCDLDETPGVHPVYGRYDARQTNIRYNHAAIVPMGRAGAVAALRMDAADQKEAAMADEPKQDDRIDDLLAKMDRVLDLLLDEDKPAEPSEVEIRERMDAANEAYASRKLDLVKVATSVGVKVEGLNNSKLTDEILKKRLGDRFRADASDEVKAAQVDLLLADVDKEPVRKPAAKRTDAVGATLAGHAAQPSGSKAEARAKAQAALQNNINKLKGKAQTA